MRYRNTSTCWWSSRNRISTSHNPNFELQPRQLMSPYQDHRFSTKVHPRTSCNSSNPSLSQTSGHLRLRLKFEPRNLPSSNLNKLCTESRNKRRKSQRRLRVSRTISFSWKVRRNKDSRWALTANRRSFAYLSRFFSIPLLPSSVSWKSSARDLSMTDKIKSVTIQEIPSLRRHTSPNTPYTLKLWLKELGRRGNWSMPNWQHWERRWSGIFRCGATSWDDCRVLAKKKRVEKWVRDIWLILLF